MSESKVITLWDIKYVATHCITCGVLYIVPEAQWEHQSRHGGFHQCTNGHRQGWEKGGTEFDKIKRERDRLQQLIAMKDDEIAAEKRTTKRAVSETKRIKKRVHAGVCPECNRTFQNLAVHMATQHSTEEKKHEQVNTTRHH